MRTWLLVLALAVTGCTSTPSADPPVQEPTRETTRETTGEPAPTEVAGPDVTGDLPRSGPPRLDVVRGHVLHRTDGTRLRVRLGLRGRWGITSLVPEGDGFLVTDDRFFEGTVGMHRVDARGRVGASWASTGGALPGPGGGAAWVSMVAPESGETGSTVIHTSSGSQRLGSLIMPTLGSFDGDSVTFSALQQEGRRYVRRGFVTDLLDPPRRAPLPTQRITSPDGRHWVEVRGRVLVIGGQGGEVELPARPFVRAWSRPVWEDDTHLLVTAHPRSAPGRRTPRPRGHAEPRRRLVALRQRRLRLRRGPDRFGEVAAPDHSPQMVRHGVRQSTSTSIGSTELRW